MTVDITSLTIHAAADMLAAGEVSAVELCQSYIDRVNAVDDKVRAFLKIDADEILANAAGRRQTSCRWSGFESI